MSTWAPLVVDTAADFLLDAGEALTETGGQPLSFRQALFIAANRPGLDLIEFDAAAFSLEVPTTIALTNFSTPLSVGAVCIDARGRGVVIRFDDEGSNMWRLESGSMQVGLTILNAPQRLFADDSSIAGCRFGTDGEGDFRGRSAWNVQVTGQSVVGPGNVFAGSVGVRVFDGPSATIIGNFFGFDPVTGSALPLREGVDVSPNQLPLVLTVAHNVFAASRAATVFDLPGTFAWVDAGSHGTFSENLVGVSPDGGALIGGQYGVGLIAAGRMVIGPGNIVRRAASAVRLGDEASVVVTQNSISDCETGISVSATPATPAPTLMAVSAHQVSGLCAVSGRVEVFADPAANGARYLGTAVCDSTHMWALKLATPVSGSNVTATLTSLDVETGAPLSTSTFSTPVAAP